MWHGTQEYAHSCRKSHNPTATYTLCTELHSPIGLCCQNPSNKSEDFPSTAVLLPDHRPLLVHSSLIPEYFLLVCLFAAFVLELSFLFVCLRGAFLSLSQRPSFVQDHKPDPVLWLCSQLYAADKKWRWLFIYRPSKAEVHAVPQAGMGSPTLRGLPQNRSFRRWFWQQWLQFHSSIYAQTGSSVGSDSTCHSWAPSWALSYFSKHQARGTFWCGWLVLQKNHCSWQARNQWGYRLEVWASSLT